MLIKPPLLCWHFKVVFLVYNLLIKKKVLSFLFERNYSLLQDGNFQCFSWQWMGFLLAFIKMYWFIGSIINIGYQFHTSHVFNFNNCQEKENNINNNNKLSTWNNNYYIFCHLTHSWNLCEIILRER